MASVQRLEATKFLLPSHLACELGLPILWHASRDVHILLALRFLRLFAFCAGALTLALYLAALGHSDATIGLYMTLALLFDAATSLLLTALADKGIGRRGTLLLCAVRQALAGLVFATTRRYWALVLVAAVGVVSPGGNDLGPFRPIEDSAVARLVGREDRSHIYAWLFLSSSLGAAAGLFGAGLLIDALERRGFEELDVFQSMYWTYAACGVVQSCLALCLSGDCELLDGKEAGRSESASAGLNEDVRTAASDETQPLLATTSSAALTENPNVAAATHGDPSGRKSSWLKALTPFSQISRPSLLILFKLTFLYILNFTASGMIPHSLLNVYIDRTFPSLSRSALGTIMSSTQLAAALANLLATPLSSRIGLVPAMVSTNFLSAVALALVPLPRHTLWAVVTLLILRTCLNTMGKAPRSAFQAAILLPEERTVVMGWLNVVKSLSQAAGPSITGLLAGKDRFWAAFVVAGGLRVAYDVGLLVWFWNARYPGEDETGEESDSNDDRYGESVESGGSRDQ